MVYAGLDTVLRCLLYRDEVPSSEWILFNHQLRPLARVSLAFFFVAVPVVVAKWDYCGLCCVRHRPPVPIVSWWGSLQWVNPLQPSIRSADQSFSSLLLCCCSSRGCNMSSCMLRRVALVRTSQKTPFFIITAVKTSNVTWYYYGFPVCRVVYTFSWMAPLMNGTFRSSGRVWSVTYQGAFVIIRSILDWLRCILAICDLQALPHIRFHRSR
jgi:hypothetical protein